MSLNFLADEIGVTSPEIIAIQIKYNPYSYACPRFWCHWLQEKKCEREREKDLLKQYRHCVRAELRRVTSISSGSLTPAENTDYWSARETDASRTALYSEIIPVRKHFIWWTRASPLASGQYTRTHSFWGHAKKIQVQKKLFCFFGRGYSLGSFEIITCFHFLIIKFF